MRIGGWILALWLLGIAGLLSGCSFGTDLPVNEAVPFDDSFRPYRSYLVGLPEDAASTGVRELGDIAGFLAFEGRLDGRVDRQTQARSIKLIGVAGYVGRVQYRYHQARDEQAGLLPFVVVRRQAQCPLDKEKPCSYKEAFDIGLPEAGLRKAVGQPYRVKVFPGIGPDLTVTIPAEAIRSLLAKLDADKPQTTAVAATQKTR